MSLYKQIKEIGDDMLDTLERVGFLKATFRRNVKIYECYLEYIAKGSPKTDAVVSAADDFNISDRQVFSIIAKFNEA